MSGAIEAVEVPMFIKKTHELSKLAKRLDKVSDGAIDVIVETMNNPKTDPKLRVACATTLTDMHIKVNDIISKDQLTRQIAELKKNGLSTPLQLQSGEIKPLPPRRDFLTIQSVGEE